MTRYDLEAPEGRLSLEVARKELGVEVTLGGRKFFVTLGHTSQPDVLLARVDDTAFRVTLEDATPNHIILVISGERFTFDRRSSAVSAPVSVPSVSARAPDTLTAPMPGKLVSLLVEEGQKVEPGSPLMVVESMKMESVLRSDRKAVVSKVLVAEGDVIRRGQPLVTFVDDQT